MALVTETKETIEVVNFLDKARANWVSIVPKGANATPFDRVKNEGGSMAGQIIQSVIVPGSPEWDELVKQPEFAALAGMMVAKTQDFNGCRAFVQVSKRDFNTDSLKAEPLGETGALVIWGDLKDGAGVTPRAKAAGDIASAMASMSDDMKRQIMGQMVSSEMWRFEDIVYGAMAQSSAAPGKRKTIIMNALDALWNFMDSFTDSMGAEALKCEKRDEGEQADNPGPPGPGSVDTNVNDTNKTDSEGDEMKKEEIVEIVKEVLEAKKAEGDAVSAPPVPGYVGEITKSITDLAGIVTELKGQVAGIVEKQADAAKGESNADASGEPIPDPVVTALKAELETLKGDFTKLLNSTGAVAPESDTRVDTAKAEGASFAGVWSGAGR